MPVAPKDPTAPVTDLKFESTSSTATQSNAPSYSTNIGGKGGRDDWTLSMSCTGHTGLQFGTAVCDRSALTLTPAARRAFMPYCGLHLGHSDTVK